MGFTPFFKTYQPEFETLKGPKCKIELVAEKEQPFAYEAGVFIPDSNELFVTSSPLIDNTGHRRHEITKIKLNSQPATCEIVPSDGVDMANGGVNYRNGVLFCAQGSMINPSALYYIPSSAPFTPELIVADFYGRPFNSVNDVVIHSDGSIWFTDPAYGFGEGYRPRPRLPNQVYRFDPQTSSIRVVADAILHPNGICFSPDEKTLYVTDSDQIWGDGSVDESRAATMCVVLRLNPNPNDADMPRYAFDVAFYHEQPFLTNRRVFSMTDSGYPDGIKCDMNGNVYSGCGDGLHVWSPGGVLLGKVMIPGGVANFCFGKRGELYLLNGTKVWRAVIAEHVVGALLGTQRST